MATNLARVPFTREEEQTISSMARWMQFIAVVGIVGGILMLFFVVLGVGLIAASQELSQSSAKWAELKKFHEESGGLLYFMLAAFLLAAIVSIWQNFALYHAGDSFDLVAKTDVADVDHLSQGLDKLRLYFKIQVMTMIVIAVTVIGTALALAAVIRHAQ